MSRTNSKICADQHFLKRIMLLRHIYSIKSCICKHSHLYTFCPIVSNLYQSFLSAMSYTILKNSADQIVLEELHKCTLEIINTSDNALHCS